VARSLALALPGKAAVVAREAALLSARLELRGQSDGVASSMGRLRRSASRMQRVQRPMLVRRGEPSSTSGVARARLCGMGIPAAGQMRG
jgi:hypothetical protein